MHQLDLPVREMPLRRHLFVPLVALLVACESPGDGASDPAELNRLRAVNDAYRAGWLAGDSAAVLRLFAADAVLLPHHGDPPVVGLDAIRRYWWPPGPASTTITTLDVTTDGADVRGDAGVLWGRFTLAFSFETDGRQRSLRNAGTYLMVLRKQADGHWRITHRMWDDPIATEQ